MRQPYLRVSLLTNYPDDVVHIDVRTNRSGEPPFPVVEVGDFTWQPTVTQMVELRDKITAYLQSLEVKS